MNYILRITLLNTLHITGHFARVRKFLFAKNHPTLPLSFISGTQGDATGDNIG